MQQQLRLLSSDDIVSANSEALRKDVLQHQLNAREATHHDATGSVTL